MALERSGSDAHNIGSGSSARSEATCLRFNQIVLNLRDQVVDSLVIAAAP